MMETANLSAAERKKQIEMLQAANLGLESEILRMRIANLQRQNKEPRAKQPNQQEG